MEDVLLKNVKNHLSVAQSLKGYGESYSININALLYGGKLGAGLIFQVSRVSLHTASLEDCVLNY